MDTLDIVLINIIFYMGGLFSWLIIFLKYKKALLVKTTSHEKLQDLVKNLANDLQTSFSGYQYAMENTIQKIQKNQFKKEIIIIFFIVCIFITLMIKYFKIYEKIGQLLGFYKNNKWTFF